MVTVKALCTFSHSQRKREKAVTFMFIHILGTNMQFISVQKRDSVVGKASTPEFMGSKLARVSVFFRILLQV